MSAHAPERCTYVYVVQARFPVIDQLPAWHRWYDEQHVPQMLTVPGIHAVRRYQDLSSPEWFAAVYDIESPAVFEHPRYAEVRGWGPWSSIIVEWSRDLLRREPFGDGAR